MKQPSKDSQPSETIWIDVKDFEFLCFNLAKELLSFSEPIPDYSTRNIPLLESALSAPKHSFDKKLLYPTIEGQATILFYSLIKNHPFINGNKRIGVMTLLIFLALNKKWLKMSPSGLYKLAIIVSNSDPSLKYIIIKKTLDLIKKYIISFPNDKSKKP